MGSRVAKIADSLVERDRSIGDSKMMASNTFSSQSEENKVFLQSSLSSYTLADDFSDEMNHWLTSQSIATENIAVQLSSVPLVQRSVMVQNPSFDRTGITYLMAVLLPIFSLTTCPQWYCSTRSVMQTAEVVMAQCVRMYTLARSHMRQVAGDQLARELFATAMDVVLIVYAIGFLILSVYQATAFN